jgi:hypothetical protein
MADQETTETAYKLLLAECADAIAAKDWSTAYTKLAAAEAVLSSFPRSTTGAAGNVTVYRADLKALGDRIDSAVSAQKHSDRNRTMKTRFGQAYRYYGGRY